MTDKTGRGPRVLLIIAVIILAATVLFTAAYALFSAPRETGARAEEKPDASPAPTEAGARPEPAGAPAVAPDWLEAERALDELAQQPAAPAPTEAPEAPEAPAENPFTDVSETDPYYDAALWALDRGVLIGDRLQPDEICSRAQAMTFLWREAGSPVSARTECPFRDVAETDYFCQPVLWAYENGLISMPQDGCFRPSDALTRAQMAVFLFRRENGAAAGLDNPFTDIAEGSYYYDAARWAYSRGIVALNDARTFDADAACTRGAFITYLYRCFAE